MTLAQQFAAYSEWRSKLAEPLVVFRDWLSENALSDAQVEQRISQLLERLSDDRLQVAFVAEFSRGKSELINAVFFANYGNRILPATVGRTTMCPTELMYDPAKPPSIELLPINTRRTNASISEYKRFPDEWTVIPLDTTSTESLQEAILSVSDVDYVSREVAEEFGFALDREETAIIVSDEEMVEVPRWRHAIINFPHPLLEKGLVILDTPGLNAIGAEPELTLSLIPNAHAVLFVLAAHTGVTQSDLAVWNNYIKPSEGQKRGRIVVLNKIDTMWDELKSEKEIDADIDKQVNSCASMLNLPPKTVFPVSAQKALVAKINEDVPLLERSRMDRLEVALSSELIQVKKEIVCENTYAVFSEVYAQVSGLLDTRHLGLNEQLGELSELRGKNRNVVEYMIGKAQAEKEEFEVALQRYYAVRSVFSTMTNRLFASLGLDALRALTTLTHETMVKATFSISLSDATKNYFEACRTNIAKSTTEIREIYAMMEAIYKKFSVEHNLKLGTPVNFSLMRYQKEIDRIEQWCLANYSTLQLMISDKNKMTQKFFDQVASRVRGIFELANADAETWLKAIVAPMEGQVREHQIQLKRRLESIKRIHQATDALEERIKELNHVNSGLLAQIDALEEMRKEVRHTLDQNLNALDAEIAAA